MSQTTQAHEVATEVSQTTARRSTSRRELTIRDIMSHEIITATSDDTILSAANRMSESNVSCIIVIDDEMVIGILTDKDILKGVAGHDTEFQRLRVEERMSSPVETVRPEESVIAAAKTMETKGIKRLPVVDGGHLVGVVTQTDITRGLISISPLKAVSDIMARDVATVDTGATVAEAARIMSLEGISCLIAMHRHAVAGIVTEKDLLRRVVALRKDPTQTQVVDVMSFPMISVPPGHSVLSAAKKMDTMHIHRLVVMADDHVCGLVTQTDIARAVRVELERLQEEYQTLAAELGSRIQHVTEDLGRLQAFLSEAPRLTPLHDWAACMAQTSEDRQRAADLGPSWRQ